MTAHKDQTSSLDAALAEAGITDPTQVEKRGLIRRLGAAGVGGLLLAGVAGLTLWSTLTPAATTTPVAPLALPAPVSELAYACATGPANSLGAHAASRQEATRFITLSDADVARSDGATLPEGVLSLNSAPGSLIRVTPGTSADASGDASASSSSASAGDSASAGTSSDSSASISSQPSSSASAGTATGDGAPETASTERSSAGSAAGVVTSSAATGDLRGLAALPCASEQSVAWIVGGSASLGSSSELRLTNPGTSAVTAQLHLYGATGEIPMLSGGQVAVPAGQTRTVLLESSAAGEARLALSVESEGGRLIAALSTENLEGETPAGVDLVGPSASPSTEQIIPGVVLEDASAGEGESPVLRIANPGESEARVRVSLIGTDGTQDLPGAQDLVIDPGAVFDVTLAGLPAGSYGIRVSSDQPVAAAAKMVRMAGEYPEASGVRERDIAWSGAQESSVLSDAVLALPAAVSSGSMNASLVLSNPGSEAETLTLRSADGEWSREVIVPAGRAMELSLGTDMVPEGTAALRLSTGGPTQLRGAVLLSQEVTGEQSGTLISVLAPQPDAAAASARQLQLR